MIEIDGSYLEGGGQIIRTSVALSCLTKKSIHIYNIRAKRKPPGLKEQHLCAINSVAELFNAELRDAFLGSKEIFFSPKERSKDFLRVKIKTAGSVGLVLQTIFLSTANSDKRLKIEIVGGGTIGKWAPSTTYLKNVFLPSLEKFGLRAEINVVREGFYPKGGAKVFAEIFPSKLKGISIERKIEKIAGVSIASKNLKKARVAERQKEGAEKILRILKLPIEIETKYVDSLSPGSAIELFTLPTRIGANSLGEIGKKAEKVGEEAGKGLLKEINSEGTVDKYLSDQLIPFMALSNGNSKYWVSGLTKHTKTNIWVTEKFLNRKFEIIRRGRFVEVRI